MMDDSRVNRTAVPKLARADAMQFHSGNSSESLMNADLLFHAFDLQVTADVQDLFDGGFVLRLS